MTQSNRNTAAPKKAFLYAREGQRAKATGKAVKTQLATLRRYARSRGLDIAGEFADVGSAIEPNRPGIRDLKTSVAAKREESVIVVLDITRLTRNLDELAEIADLNVPIHVVNAKMVVSRKSSAADKLLCSLRVLLAQAGHLKTF